MGAADTYGLLERAREGDPGARGEMLEALRARIVLWCAARMSADLRASVEPEDVAQEVLVAVCRGLDEFRGGSRASFYAWVFRIAENRIRDAVDHFGAAKRQSEPLPQESPTTPGTAAARNESLALLRKAIERLPEDYRRVVQLHRFEDLAFADVAAALGRTENAARILYCRALKALREELPQTG